MGGAKGLLLIIKHGLTNHDNLPPPLKGIAARQTFIAHTLLGSEKELNICVHGFKMEQDAAQ